MANLLQNALALLVYCSDPREVENRSDKKSDI